MEKVYETLKQLGVTFETREHPAVYTVEEARNHRIGNDFGENKNLFVRNKKGDRHYLITVAADKNVDLKILAKKLGENRFGFASEDRMQKFLGLSPGAVSPFGLINDTNSEVIYVFDNVLLKSEKLGFHPNINTQTIILDTKDFETYLDSLENKIIKIDL